MAEVVVEGVSKGTALLNEGLSSAEGLTAEEALDYGARAFKTAGGGDALNTLTDRTITGIEDLFETDAALERKKLSKERGDIIESEMKDRKLARKFAEENHRENLRRQRKHEDLQEKLVNRELAGGKPLGYVPPPPVIKSAPSIYEAPPSILPAFDAAVLMQKERNRKHTTEKADAIKDIVEEGYDLIKHGASKERRMKKEKDNIDEMHAKQLKEEKAKYKRKKEKAVKKALQKSELKELERKAEEAKRFLKEHDALTKRKERDLDTLELRKELSELRRLEAEEKRRIKKEDEAEKRALRQASK